MNATMTVRSDKASIKDCIDKRLSVLETMCAECGALLAGIAIKHNDRLLLGKYGAIDISDRNLLSI